MNLFGSIKTAITKKNKKAITIMFVTIAVAVTSFTAGAVVVSTGLISKESSSNKLSSNNTSEIATITKSTEISSEGSYSIKLAKEKIAIIKGDTYSILLADGMEKEKLNLNWSTDNEKIATVDKNGIVKAISTGDATITCTNTADNTWAKLIVTVSEPVYADDIQLDKESYKMTTVGELLKLNATITPEDKVTDTKLVWSTSDEDVVTVKDGLVKSVGEGTATITCTTSNDLSAECEIIVEPVVKAEELTLDYIGYDFEGPQTQSVLLTPTISPDNATNKTVKWHSTDENVALVDEEGYVTVVGDGECDIVCTTTDGTYLSATCEVKATGTMAVVTHTTGTSVYVPVNPVPANSVLEEALRYVGVIPYVWGGTDLSSGVDCSGFICAVYERFGVNLWGVRTDLYLAGVEVPSIEEAKAGDILCYPGHVAIYDGNGGRVHAYDEGYMVMRDYNIDGYYTIRRIIE